VGSRMRLFSELIFVENKTLKQTHDCAFAHETNFI